MLSAIAALGGAALGGLGSVLNNERNLSFQRENQDYMKWAQGETWRREDTAAQRRYKDLQAAGLHPTLAAGSAAAASAPVKIDPMSSQDGYGLEGAVGGAVRGAQTQQSIMAAQAAQSQIDMNKASVLKIGAEAAKAASMNEVIRKEWGLGKDQPMIMHPKYQDPWGKRFTEGAQMIKDMMQNRPNKPTHVNKRDGRKYTRKGMINYYEGQLVPEFAPWDDGEPVK